MSLTITGSTVHLACGLTLALTAPGDPLRRTRAQFVQAEMAARRSESDEMRSSLSSFYSSLIRDAVGCGLLSLDEARAVGEGFLGEIGMNDRIRANCRRRRPWQMRRAEFAILAAYIATRGGKRCVEFVEDDPGQLPVSCPVVSDDETTLRQAHAWVVQKAIVLGHPVPDDVLEEYATLPACFPL